MPFSVFLRALADEGRVRVPGEHEPGPADLESARPWLRELEQAARSNAPGRAPEYNLEAAQWAALVLYRGCQFLVRRDVGSDVVRDALAQACPEARSSATIYSVDLCFVFLPDLQRLAVGIAPGDPLVDVLKRLGWEWPLSSVGMQLALDAELDLGPIRAHRCLWQTYIDRVVAHDDIRRLGDPQTRDAVRQALGLYPNLAPRGIARELKLETADHAN